MGWVWSEVFPTRPCAWEANHRRCHPIFAFLRRLAFAVVSTIVIVVAESKHKTLNFKNHPPSGLAYTYATRGNLLPTVEGKSTSPGDLYSTG